MRLDYQVLCIDDKIETLKDTQRQIEECNSTVGIQTNFIDISVKKSARQTELEEFKNKIFGLISKEFKNNLIDLIIVDLHLDGFKGGEIIHKIRESQTIYRPIVFYSGNPGNADATGELQEALRENNLVGKSVFITERERLTTILLNIFKEMHIEEHKLNASRGLLMDRSSEIDAKILKYLQTKKTWEGFSVDQSASILKAIRGVFKNRSKREAKHSKKMEEISEYPLKEFVEWMCDTAPSEVIDSLDAFNRSIILRELLRLSPDPDHEEYGKLHSSYFNPIDGKKDGASILKIRNEYAHKTEEQIGKDHNDKRCKYIRNELRKHLNNISELA